MKRTLGIKHLFRYLSTRLRTAHLPRTVKAWAGVLRDACHMSGLPEDPGNARCVEACVEWLLEAQKHSISKDGGVARHFDLNKGWSESYPETTGYIIPTLLDQAGRMEDGGCLREAAERMLCWLVTIQLPEGGFLGGHGYGNGRVPVVFDTGQILFGLAAGLQEFGQDYEMPLRKACDWLMSNQDEDGAWRVPNPFAVPGVHTWETHVAWGMLVAAEALGDPAVAAAGLRQIRWAAARQLKNGWYPDCGLSHLDRESPLTHTIGYTLRGILEGAMYAKDDGLLRAVVVTADALMGAQLADGSLPGQLDANWKAAASWSCLTGCCQIALCWLLLHQITGREDYFDAACRANAFVRRTVRMHGPSEQRGGVKGSFPVWGSYGQFQYLNWACKFLIDACVLEETVKADKQQAGGRG